MSIITISRGTFSGGKAVAEKLAEHLGYPLFQPGGHYNKGIGDVRY